MLRIACVIVVLARVCLAATPGKLVAPGVVEVELKDGQMANVSCPEFFQRGIKRFFQPQDIANLTTACLKADFETVDGCDTCLSAFASAAFKSQVDEQYQLSSLMSEIPFALIPRMNFSNGCPFAQACKSALVESIDEDTAVTPDPEDDALGKAFAEMIDKCTGPNPGPDYPEAFKGIQKIAQSLAVPTPPSEAPQMEIAPSESGNMSLQKMGLFVAAMMIVML